jgi:PPOX class probable F420-dependent enzyme
MALMTALPDSARTLLDAANLVVVATVSADGSPQTSVVWATYDGDDLLMSTIEGRLKPKNWRARPQTSALILDRDDALHYVELRGPVEVTDDDGDPGLIQVLAQAYTGGPFTGDDGTDHRRLVCRLTPTKVVEH